MAIFNCYVSLAEGNENDPFIDDLWVYHGLPIKHVKFLQFPEVNSSNFDPSLVALTVRLAASREEGRGAAGSNTATESCRPRGLNHPGGMITLWLCQNSY